MAGTAITIALIAGWLLSIVMGLAVLAMAHQIGSRYVFTHAGVARLGPTIGERLDQLRKNEEIGRLVVAHRGRSHAYMLAFLNLYSNLSVGAAQDLLRLASSTGEGMSFVLLYIGNEEKRQRLAARAPRGAGNVLWVPLRDPDPLQTDLMIRVMPYALMIDQDLRLIAKGLVNHVGHLCQVLTAGAALMNSGEVDRSLAPCRRPEARLLQLDQRLTAHSKEEDNAGSIF